jgi:hypothetical protein
MATHTPQEHAQLYGELRAQLLSRFFAFGRYFRANHLSLVNELGYVNREASNPPKDADDPVVDCDHHVIERPTAYANAAKLLDLPLDAQTTERWRVAVHGRENPLLYGSQLLLALAIEHALGRQGALAILRLGIDAIGKLYKFGHMGDFAGYILRWDPVTSDHWTTRLENGKSRPWFCCEFLLDDNYQYHYCTPFNHPSYVPYDPGEFFAQNPERPSEWRTYTTNDEWPARVHSVARYRNWEPSMDELVGLVLTYDIVFALVDDAALRTEIRRQVTALSRYLARHGYLMVRPCGGFSARGASGALPAMEFPFSRVFERITGQPVEAAADFEQAMVKAGVWDCIRPSVQRWGIAGGVVLGALGVGLGGLLATPLVTITGILGVLGGYYAGRAFGVYQARDCFDVAKDSARAEFSAAYLLKLLPSRRRFLLWMDNVGRGTYARNFPQFIGLTGLQDPTDTTIKDAYLAALPAAQTDARGRFRNTGFAAAVAVALGATAEEPNLRKFLDDAYDSLTGDTRKRAPMLEDAGSHVIERIRNGTPNGTPEDPLGSLEYLACLALSWLRAKRLADAGDPVDPARIVPLPATTPAWPVPTIPAAVTRGGVIPAVEMEGTREPLPVFPAGTEEPGRQEYRPPEPPSAAPPVTRIDTFTVSVPESSALVDAGITIQLGDAGSMNASGSIWAGVWLTGENGPNGWNYIENGSKFPRPGTNPFCLLYKIVPPGKTQAQARWEKLGTSLAFAAVSANLTGTLLFRTNDDVPGNGSGAFSCTVTIKRAAP